MSSPRADAPIEAWVQWLQTSTLPASEKKNIWGRRLAPERERVFHPRDRKNRRDSDEDNSGD